MVAISSPSWNLQHESRKIAEVAVLQKTFRWLCNEQSWPAPLFGDSGNGYHGLYRIDLPDNDGSIVERCLTALAIRFDTSGAKIDTAVFAPLGSVGCTTRGTARERTHPIAHTAMVNDIPEDLASDKPDCTAPDRTTGGITLILSRIEQGQRQRVDLDRADCLTGDHACDVFIDRIIDGSPPATFSGVVTNYSPCCQRTSPCLTRLSTE